MASFAEGLVGITLDDRYRLDAVLGEGGMGAVFRATHLAMERKVAVKLLKPHLASNEASLQRFLREARSTMKVDSPHAVKVLDYGVTPHRDYYIVLEYLDGRTVQRELDIDGVFAPARVAHIARQALHALAAAHATGLIHRDLKPENILLMRVGNDPDYTKLLDFGVAKLMEGTAHSAQSQLALTQVGTVFGTPEFMSPEQACGHPLDGRSDLYSLGATMFAMLTGCGLFDVGSPIEWLTSHVRTPPPHLTDVRPELNAYPELDDLIQRCLAKHRDLRPASASELADLLAKLEPTLVSRVPGTPPSPSGKVKPFSTSMFFTAVEAAGLGTTPPRQSTRDLLAAARPRRRWLYGLIAVALIAVGATAVVMATRSDQTAAPLDALAVTTAADARSAIDAATGEPLIDARPPVDAPPSPPPDASLAPDARITVDDGALRNRQRQVAEHLKAAEAGLAAGNNLAQMTNADLALQLDPRNVRARYLLADALIKGGDKDAGCQHLRLLGRNALARRLAESAGCAQ